MANIRRLVLDVSKPHSPNMLEIAKQLADLDGVDGVDVSLIEMDNKVENIKIIKTNGAAIHSLDKISVGTSLIEEVTTQQD